MASRKRAEDVESPNISQVVKAMTVLITKTMAKGQRERLHLGQRVMMGYSLGIALDTR